MEAAQAKLAVLAQEPAQIADNSTMALLLWSGDLERCGLYDEMRKRCEPKQQAHHS
jgi:hypothetical protein